ncbi:TIGR02677 family protein, partial [Streptomyces sp. NPDC048551]
MAYLWVLRAMNVLRAVHQPQVHPDDVANALKELATAHDEVPSAADLNLRAMLDNLSSDTEQVL